MYVSFKSTTWKLLALTLVVALWGFGPAALQAKDKNQHYNGCGCAPPPPKPCPAPCPAPQLQKPGCPTKACCPLPQVQKPCGPTCCPVDPKAERRAQRKLDNAQHEAAEACARQERAVARAQRDQERAFER